LIAQVDQVNEDMRMNEEEIKKEEEEKEQEK